MINGQWGSMGISIVDDKVTAETYYKITASLNERSSADSCVSQRLMAKTGPMGIYKYHIAQSYIKEAVHVDKPVNRRCQTRQTVTDRQ